MIYLGCHLTSSKGFENMAKEAISINADTLQFFTRNPRGGKAKDIDPQDVEKYKKMAKEYSFGKVIAHAPYTLNPCSKEQKTRDFAYMVMEDDLKRMEHIPGNYYNFHPGSHVGQGTEAGIEMISFLLNEIITEEQTTTVLLETMAGKGSEIGDAGYDIAGDLDGVLKMFDDIIGLDYLKAIHINDSKNPIGAHKDRHEVIGAGYIGLEAFKKILTHPSLQGLPFVLETPQENLNGYGEEIKMLREMIL